MVNENWVTINDFPNYLLSDKGRVMNKSTAKLVATPMHQHGYRCVRLWKNNKTKLFKLYRLIAIHFIPNQENKKFINHIDGNRLNEELSNLEWCTASENMIHAYKNNLSVGNFKKGDPGGIKQGHSTLSIDDRKLLGQWYKSGFYDERKMPKIFGVTGPYATRVARKEALNA